MVLALVCIPIVTVVPVFWIIVVLNNPHMLVTEGFNSLVGTLYTDQRVLSQSEILFPFIYFMRRLLMALILIFLSQTPSLQVHSIVLLNLFSLIYLAKVDPL